MERLPCNPNTRTESGRQLNGQRLVLWRHGRTAWNADGRFQGQTDVALDEIGLAQADRAAALLAALDPSYIASSDLARAHQTATALASACGLSVSVDADLRETHGGQWQGLNGEEIRANHRDLMASWAEGDDVAAGMDGERRSEVAVRMLAGIERALSAAPSQSTVVVVSHGGAIRAAIGALLGLPIEYWSSLGVLANCAWSVLEESAGTVVSKTGTGDPLSLAGTIKWRLSEYNAGSLPEPVIGDDR